MTPFDIIKVSSLRREKLEQLGTKSKYWFTDDDNRQMLFKAVKGDTGEDWSEKIACELCRLLDLPHVHYELAVETEEDKRGVVCQTCAPPPMSLVLGNQLLFALDANYPRDHGRKYKVHQHTVEAVRDVVRTLKPPPTPYATDISGTKCTALDVFLGYVMLDAWIGNQDRHHENWGALTDGENLYLAPTFDHAAGMARNLMDEERQERLTTRDGKRQIAYFARRARSAFYKDDVSKKPMSTFDAWHAFSQFSSEATMIWLRRLSGVSEASVRQLLETVPNDRISDVGREFTLRLLMENRRRLLEGDAP